LCKWLRRSRLRSNHSISDRLAFAVRRMTEDFRTASFGKGGRSQTCVYRKFDRRGQEAAEAAAHNHHIDRVG
jgi:hypothetical protein